jgi:hypothetical protein
MIIGFVLLGLVVLGVALVARNGERMKPGEKASRPGRGGITPVYRRPSGEGVNGSSVGFLGLGGVGGFGGHHAGGFDGGSCGTGDSGSGGGDSGGSC